MKKIKVLIEVEIPSGKLCFSPNGEECGSVYPSMDGGKDRCSIFNVELETADVSAHSYKAFKCAQCLEAGKAQ